MSPGGLSNGLSRFVEPKYCLNMTLKNVIVNVCKALSPGKMGGKATLNTLETAEKEPTPWWVIVLKTLVYLIGLLLAGYGTSAAAQSLFMC